VLEFNEDVPEQEQSVEGFLLYIKKYSETEYNLFEEEPGTLTNLVIMNIKI